MLSELMYIARCRLNQSSVRWKERARLDTSGRRCVSELHVKGMGYLTGHVTVKRRHVEVELAVTYNCKRKVALGRMELEVPDSGRRVRGPGVWGTGCP